MVHPEQSNNEQIFKVYGPLSAEANKLLGDFATGLGVTLVPVETTKQVATVTLDDLLSYGQSVANTKLEEQRNPVAARQVWRRSQQLCAAREAHVFGSQLVVSSSYRHQALPHMSPLDFLIKPVISNPNTMNSNDWNDWSTQLNDLKLNTIKDQLARLPLHSRGQAPPLGLGIGKARILFLEGFVNRTA